MCLSFSLFFVFLKEDFYMSDYRNEFLNFLARFRIQPSTLWSGGARQCHSIYNCKYSIKVLSVLMTFLLCYNSAKYYFFKCSISCPSFHSSNNGDEVALSNNARASWNEWNLFAQKRSYLWELFFFLQYL